MARDRSGPITALLLAAGSSARMGRNKLLLHIDGESVLRRAARRAHDAGLEPLAVLGHDEGRVREELYGLPCRTVVNPDWHLGKSASVRAGISAVPPEAVAAVVILPDMPLVTAVMLAELAAAYRGGEAPVVASRYGGEVLAPPMLYDRALFGELAAMEGDGCGKHVVHLHRREALILDWPREVLADLDVPADYDRFHPSTEASPP
jgi:molybdenum cofactor cytidylyltransferase